MHNIKGKLKSKLLGNNAQMWHSSLKSSEGLILKIGVGMTLIYAIGLVLGLKLSPKIFQSLIAMATANIFLGRATSISLGYTMGLERNIIVPFIMLSETLLVLLWYPLFVFSIRYLLVIPALENIMKRIKKTAESNYPTIRKYGIIGLFLFVWFPFWMTGPVVGCIIGYFLGLRPSINMLVVLSGTYIAIFCWSIFIRILYEKVAIFNPFFPMILLAIAVFIVAIRFLLRTRHDADGSRKQNK